MPTRPRSPHDALVRATFSQIDHARGLVQAALPGAIVARFDLGTLTLCPGSFVDGDLRQRHSDLLFSVDLASRDARIYVLFEHQSTVEALMAFRMLLYMTRIWERHRRTHPKATRLPVIVPLLLHHSRRGWAAATTFEGLLDADDATLAALGEHTVRLRLVLDDISDEDDSSLRTRAMTALGRLVLFCLRRGREPEELMRRLQGFRDLIAEARRAPNGGEALGIVWRYILASQPRKRPELVMAHLSEAAGNEAKEEFMSVADVLVERGRKAGRREGARDLLLLMLRTRFGDLSADAVARVQAASPRKLQRIAQSVLTAATMDDALGAR